MPAQQPPLVLSAQKVLDLLRTRHPRDRYGYYTPHTELGGCWAAYPEQPDLWCAACLAGAVPAVAQDWVADVYQDMAHEEGSLVPVGTVPGKPTHATTRWLVEDVREYSGVLRDALADTDPVEVAGAACDLIEAVLEATLAWGLDLRPVWASYCQPGGEAFGALLERQGALQGRFESSDRAQARPGGSGGLYGPAGGLGRVVDLEVSGGEQKEPASLSIGLAGSAEEGTR